MQSFPQKKAGMAKWLLPAIVFCIFAAASANGQSILNTDPDIVAEAYLAPADKEGKAGAATKDFLTTDIPIFCVVRLSDVRVADIKLNLIAANVAGVKPETRVVSTSYTTGEGEDRVNFTGKPHGSWVPGTYRADIYVGGVLVRSLDFHIAKPIGDPATVTAVPTQTKSTPRTRQLRRKP